MPDFHNQSIMNVQIPPQGYAKGYVPVEAKTFTLSEPARITFDCNGVPFAESEFYKKVGGRVKLVVASERISRHANAMAASNALLPSDCRLEVSSDEQTLYLITPSRQATMILMR